MPASRSLAVATAAGIAGILAVVTLTLPPTAVGSPAAGSDVAGSALLDVAGWTAAGRALSDDPAPDVPARTVSDASEESPCIPDVTKIARPGAVRLGHEVGVALTTRVACPGEFPLHLVLLLDRSSFMAGAPLDQVKTVASGLVRALAVRDHPTTRAGVVSFDVGARTVVDLTNDEAAALEAIDGLVPATDGAIEGARIDVAIAEGVRVLTRGRAAARDLTEILVILAGGRSENGPELALVAAGNAKTQGVLVISMCFLDTCDTDLMRQLASSPRYYFSPTSSGLLERVVQEIRERDLTVVLSSLTITDTLPAAMVYVPGSASPEPSASGAASEWLQWHTVYVSKAGVTQTLRVRPSATGSRPTNLEARGSMLDRHGRSREIVYPVPSVIVLPPTGGLDESPCELEVARVAAPTVVVLGDAVTVTATARLSCPTPPREMVYADYLSPDVAYVPDSGGTGAYLVGERGLYLSPRSWGLGPDGKLIATYTYVVRPLRAGDAVPLSADAFAAVADDAGGADAVELPQVRIQVKLGAVPTPSRTATPPDTTTPTVPPPPRAIFLPAVHLNACTPQTCWASADIVLVADLSPSMREVASAGNPLKLLVAKEAMLWLADDQRSSGQVALLACNGAARMEYPLAPVSASAFDTLTAKVRALAPQSEGSRLDLCIEAAHAELGSARHDASARPVIALFTDGRTDAATRHAVVDAAARARAQRTRVIVLGVGTEIDTRFLASLTGSPAYVRTAKDVDEAQYAGHGMYYDSSCDAPCPPATRPFPNPLWP